MGVRRGVGNGIAFGWVRVGRLVLAIALCVALGAQAETRSIRPMRAVDYHATVMNGAIMGSAFQIADGLVVTNAHVVRGLGAGDTVALVTADDDRVRSPARVIAVSSRMDLAVLAVPPGLLPTVGVAGGSGRPGARVIAAGIDATAAVPGPRFEVEGIVLAPQVDLPTFGPGMVARLAGVRPGFSGGPMLDGRGGLVGMVTAIRPGPRLSRPTGATRMPLAGAAAPDQAFALRADAIMAEVERLLTAATR